MGHRLVPLLTAGFVFVLLAPAAVSAAPPANDNLLNATVIGALPFTDTASNAEATVEPGESQYCRGAYAYRTLWYSITPSTDAVLQADMTGSIPYDHYLAVYSGSGPEFSKLSRITCATYSDSVTFKVVAGSTYYFQVSDQWSSGGSLQLNLAAVVPPPNDDFEDATAVTGFPFADSVDLASSTIEPGEPTGCYYSTDYRKSIWYVITATATGAATFINSTLSDVELSAYRDTGGGIGSLLSVGCFYGNWYSGTKLTFTAYAGETYYVLARTTVSTSGTLSLSATFTPSPANDAFAAATAIGSLPYSNTSSNAATTRETDEPLCPDSNYGTAWYSFTPTTTGSLTARLAGGYGNYPVVGVFTGADLTSLTQIGCNTKYDAGLLTWHAEGGVTHFIQVSSKYYPVELSLELFVTPPPVADLYWGPTNANIYTSVSFTDVSTDPGGVGFGPAQWDFGDGATAVGQYAYHQYARDGDYTVAMTATTLDGRSASTSEVVSIRTHDIGIAKFIVPAAASAGQTTTITVGVGNRRYPESVNVQLFKGTTTPYYDQILGEVIKDVPVLPANKTMSFTFSYTFTSADVLAGKVTFRAVAAIWSGGSFDAYMADNQAVATTKTNK